MSEMNRHELMLEVLAELAPELRTARKSAARATSRLSRTLEEFLPLPPHSLFLGVANDGLPVLLNMADSVPGPMLVAGDQGSGKSALLRVIAASTDIIHRPEDVQYGVITSNPEEWKGMEGSHNLVEVFHVRGPAGNGVFALAH